MNFTNEGGVHGSTRLLKNIGGMWIFQQLRKSFLRRGNEMSFADMVAAAETASAFTCWIDPDDPQFVAPDDMIDAIEAYAAATGQIAPADPSSLCRAALEGLALRYRICLGMLESITGSSMRTIHVVGGGSLNALLCQMTADACNRTVVAGPVEGTAIGNVLVQMIGTGQLDSIESARRLVRASFDTTTYQPQSPGEWAGTTGFPSPSVSKSAN